MLKVRALKNLFSARLSRRIVLWVFLSILLVEIIILIPSVQRRKREKIDQLTELVNAMIHVMVRLVPPTISAQDLLTQITQLDQRSLILGGALYTADGTSVGQFGTPPTLTYADVQRGILHRQSNQLTRYDMAWMLDDSPLEQDFLLVLRLNTLSVRNEIIAFIGRIAGLVLLIAIFVTLATMFTLESMVLSPIMLLRSDLREAGDAIAHDRDCVNFASLKHSPQDELGDVIRVFEEMYRQVTQAIALRKQSEVALRASEEKFSKAFRSSPNSVTLGSLEEGRFLEVNTSFTNLFGYTAEEAVGHTATELNLWLTPSDRQMIVQQLETNGAIRNQEINLRRKSGEILTVLFSAEILALNGNHCLLAVITDISERKRALRALEESEERFRTLVEQAADAIYVVDCSGQFVDVNQRACENLRYTRDELLKLNVKDIQLELPPGGYEEFWRRLAQGELLTIEGHHRRKDGTAYAVEVRADMFEAGGKHFVMAISRDVTERKQAEQAMARLAEIGELAAMIVHEVRNPLTTVLMGLQSFGALTELPDRYRLRLQLALEEADRLKRLLNEILLYARQQSLNFEPIELNAFMKELLVVVQSMPSAVGRIIDFAPAVADAYIAGDRDKLKQVFINLIANACEAIVDGEQVSWNVALNETQCQVWVYIRNGGEPIPADVLPKLTQPFFTTKSSGNGLGLAIVKRIVESHGGDLLIESTQQSGTTVTVKLPICSKAQNA